MSHIRVLICQVDDEEAMTEVAVYDLPAPAREGGEAASTLDELERTTQRTGNAILREMMQAQWALLDQQLTDQYMAQAEPGRVQRDGQEPIMVASRFGRIQLSRQVCSEVDGQGHIMSGNAVLPAHHGLIVTRGLQEWACLLSQDVSFATATRLLGWQTQEEQILSCTTLRTLVRRHGQVIREAEQAEVEVLLQQPEVSATLHVRPPQPARRADWPEALNAAVDAALAAERQQPRDGVSWADWARVLAARRQDAGRTVPELRQLGPMLAPNQVLLTMDEVLTRQTAPQHFWELRMVRIVTPDGDRYVTGTGSAFLQQVLMMVLLATGNQRALLLIADGARWIRTFFLDTLSDFPDKQLILDWYHLHDKCRDFCRLIDADRLARVQLLRRLTRRLWRGNVASAVRLLEWYRLQSHDIVALDGLLSYLRARQPFIPNYRQRRIDQRFIDSAHAEKANDLLVARRQKRGGMQWSLPTSDGLTALSTLSLNDGWNRYWDSCQVLPLAA